MNKSDQNVFRVELPPKPDIAIHILRTPPSTGSRDDGGVTFSGLDLKPPQHPRASRDLLLQTLGLPRSMFPEQTVFLPEWNGPGLMLPWRMHPKFDLMVPAHFVDELHVRDRWRVEAFISPSTIGLTYVRWLLAEALAAGPAPFGTPGRGRSGAEIEQLLFPSIANGRVPTEMELLRAVFLVHEAFEIGSRSPGSVTVDWVLSLTAAHSFGVHLFSTPEDRLVRARRMWLVPDDHPRIPNTEFRPSELRDRFASIVGMSVDLFLMFTSIALTTVRASAIRASPVVDLLGRLISEKGSRDWAVYQTTVRRWLAASPGSLRRRIREEMSANGVEYAGWGTVPTAPTRQMMDHPVLALSDGSLVLWSSNAMSDRAADLPRFVLRSSGGGPIRSHIGRLFEAYVHDRLTQLAPSRHRILHEEDLETVLPDKVADYVAAHGRDLLIVEVSSMGTPHSLAGGNADAVRNKLADYVRKHEQASAVKRHQHRIARELLGLNAAALVAEIVVTQDAIPNSPAMSEALGGESFICTADEFELVLDLAEVGWSLPQLVSGWQQSGRPIPLGAYLMEHQAIHSRDFSTHRWARAIADQFNLEAA